MLRLYNVPINNNETFCKEEDRVNDLEEEKGYQFISRKIKSMRKWSLLPYKSQRIVDERPNDLKKHLIP